MTAAVRFRGLVIVEDWNLSAVRKTDDQDWAMTRALPYRSAAYYDRGGG